MDDEVGTGPAVTVARLWAAADTLGPVTLHAASTDDAHGFAEGLLLAEWAGPLAPPPLVCRRALFLLAVPKLWYASLRRHLFAMRWDGAATGNPVVHARFPDRLPADADATVDVPAAEVVAALALQVEVLQPHEDDVLRAWTPEGDPDRLVVRIGRAGGWTADPVRLDVLAWVLGLDRPTVERSDDDAVEVSLGGDPERVRAAVGVLDGWAAQRAARRALHAFLDEHDASPSPAVPDWDGLIGELDALGIVVEYDDRQEDPSGDRGIVPRIDLGEPVAHTWLSWEAPYDGQTPWLELGTGGTQDRFLRALLWARAEPARWTPRLVQAPVTQRPPWVNELSW